MASFSLQRFVYASVFMASRQHLSTSDQKKAYIRESHKEMNAHVGDRHHSSQRWLCRLFRHFFSRFLSFYRPWFIFCSLFSVYHDSFELQLTLCHCSQCNQFLVIARRKMIRFSSLHFAFFPFHPCFVSVLFHFFLLSTLNFFSLFVALSLCPFIHSSISVHENKLFRAFISAHITNQISLCHCGVFFFLSHSRSPFLFLGFLLFFFSLITFCRSSLCLNKNRPHTGILHSFIYVVVIFIGHSNSIARMDEFKCMRESSIFAHVCVCARWYSMQQCFNSGECNCLRTHSHGTMIPFLHLRALHRLHHHHRRHVSSTSSATTIATLHLVEAFHSHPNHLNSI